MAKLRSTPAAPPVYLILKLLPKEQIGLLERGHMGALPEVAAVEEKHFNYDKPLEPLDAKHFLLDTTSPYLLGLGTHIAKWRLGRARAVEAPVVRVLARVKSGTKSHLLALGVGALGALLLLPMLPYLGGVVIVLLALGIYLYSRT